MQHLSYFNLIDALKQDGCPVCTLVNKTIHAYMENLLDENVNNPNFRDKFNETMGFCNLHAWQLYKFNDGLGQSILYKDLLNIIVEKMEKIKVNKNEIKNLRKQVIDNKKANCLICAESLKAEERYAHAFIENFYEKELKNLFLKSSGLCFNHFLQIAEQCKNKELINEICEIEIKKNSLLIKKLNEYLKKNDYRLMKEKLGDEKYAWIKAIEKITGKEGMIF